ncbi:hypothetical protein GCM10020229_81020 [Kitasatospora albolonga]|uniref:hypothetical protein n=1 Tax=Kitasatospora albolonga TaxID=68173 RepID=UPI0031EE296F
MGALIRSAAVSTDPTVRSAVDHARIAAQACLDRAGVGRTEVDLVVNVGVYRDENLIEPAVAALVQSDLGINPDYARDAATAPTLSFDLLNGACGLVNAVQVAQAFLTAGQARNVLVTAADAHPSGADERPVTFPYDATGAALLLTRGEDPRAGFGPVTATPPAAGPPVVEGYSELAPAHGRARHEVVLRAAPDATDRLAEQAALLARSYAARHDLDLRRTRLLVSRTTPGLAEAVVRRLGLPTPRRTPSSLPAPAAHTASLIADYLEATAAGRPSTLLFLAVGAGPSAACTAYRPAAPIHPGQGPR